jgi:hypothetical protein
MKELKDVTTKTGFVIKESWCRRCVKMRPASDFYDAVDAGLVDKNGLLSVCKDCVQDLYNEFFQENGGSMEKAIHKICTTLNIRFSNEAVSATREHIQTLLASGKTVNVVFGVYKQKLISVQKTMDKSLFENLTYEDVGTIFTEKAINTKEIPIPQNVIEFWGKDLKRDDIEFLESQYTNFKATHKADTYAEIVLLKQVCYTMLDIKNARLVQDDTSKLVKELQDLMKNLAISPNAINIANADKGIETFGLWIADIEREEPAQWLLTDPRGDMYRDVGNVEEYFQKYFVRPLKNFITGSKDFNIDDSDGDEEFDLMDGESINFGSISDGNDEG